MDTIGERLRKSREKKELTQIRVKELTGINNKTLSGYENNVSIPDPETFKILASLYEVTIDYLMGRENSKKISGNEKQYSNTNISTKAYHTIDASGLNDDDIKKVEEYIDLLKQRYNSDGSLKKR